MGFELPLALLALAAAGLPILAHLLKRRDLPTRRLPTIRLLERAEAQSRRRFRLVDLLLLIVRVLLIAIAALAIAGPYVSERLDYGDGRVASVVIVIDDSLSMSGRGDPTLLARAIEHAEAATRALPAGSEVALVLAGSPPRVRVPRTEEPASVRRALATLERDGARGTDLAGALELAERELAGARHASRRVLLLSDLAAHGGLDEGASVSGAALDVVPLGEGAAIANAAIRDARAAPDPSTPGQLSIAVEVFALGLDGQTAPLRLSRGEEVVAETEVTLDSPGTRVTLHAPFDAETTEAELRLEVDDAIAVDNRRSLRLSPPEEARVLIVDGDPHPVRGSEQARFLLRALELIPPEQGRFTARTVDPDTFADSNLDPFEVIVLVNVAAPGARAAERLRAHVAGGAGLFIAAGEEVEPRAYAARLGPLLPARPRAAIRESVAGPRATDEARWLVRPDGLGRATTQTRLQVDSPAPSARTEAAFEDGSPALLVAPHGEGRVAMLTTSLDDSWTDLPYRPGFLALVAASMRGLSPEGGAMEGPYAAGAEVRLQLPSGATSLRITSPDGARSELDVSEHPEGAPFLFGDTALPGLYRAEVATRSRGLEPSSRLSFVIVPAADESDLEPGPVPGAEADDAAARAGMTGAIVRRPLAPWLFLLVGLLAVAEGWLRLRGRLGVKAPPRNASAAA